VALTLREFFKISGGTVISSCVLHSKPNQQICQLIDWRFETFIYLWENLMLLDLTTDEQLLSVLNPINPSERHPDWLNDLELFLTYVRNSSLDDRKTKSFHQRIWEENPVSSVGMGTVDISKAIDDPEFRVWLAESSLKPVPETSEERIEFFRLLSTELVERLKSFSSRTPWVKIFRVFAAFYPRFFSTIAYDTMALECHKAWFGRRRNLDRIQTQLDLMSKLEKLLRPCEDESRALANRMTLPWIIYEDHIRSNNPDADIQTVTPSGDAKLKPLPALQRRKGITSIRGGLDTLYSTMGFVADGVSREELMDYLRAEFSDYRENSLRTLINILKNEFYIIAEEKGQFTLTERGVLYLETNDPQELIPPFLTRILGVDHVIKTLANGTKSIPDLVALLQQVNPGWTSDFAPRSMLKWLRDFKLIEYSPNGVHITETGKSWVGLIHWEPEMLPAKEMIEPAPEPENRKTINLAKAELTSLVDNVVAETAFPRRIVSQLHLGLWAHSKRHFAVLAGLSGSGKTLLAMKYAETLAGYYTNAPAQNVFTLAVQPGWYDPSSLFGYINPLLPDNYIRPPLLDFLLLAAQSPDQPFTVILDEMNLSHPEQYFAPVLSSMESNAPLRLHNEGDSFDGVPNMIPYPVNVSFIGTVNMDETTHGISDKVLDRAFTLEFWDIDLRDYPNWDQHGLSVVEIDKVKTCLSALLQALVPVRLHFGWRTVEDVLTYIKLARNSPEFDLTVSLDDVIFSRVLPKLRGSENNRLHIALDNTIIVLSEQNLNRSYKKVKSLKEDLSDTGIMRFWR
jgi:hypothetical protein